MPILVSCPCGKRLRARDDQAGKRMRCPGCGEAIAVPTHEDEGAREARPGAPPPLPRAKAEAGPAEAPSFWVDPNALGGTVIALSDEALFVADLDEQEFKRAQKALRKGEPVEEVLDEPKAVIPFDQLRKVESNLHHRFVDLTWKPDGGGEETEMNLLCPDAQTRDEVMGALQERLGWKRRLVEFSRLRASVAPLVVILIFGFMTFCFVMAALYPDSGGGRTRVIRTNWIGAIFVWIYNIFGPVGVALLGAPFVLAGVVWLAVRLHKPPLMLMLTPPGGGGRGKKGRR